MRLTKYFIQAGDPVALPQVGEPPGRQRTTQPTTLRTTTR
jgi:hypothetical protein